jgi:DNA repair protein RadA/Sms
MTKGRRRFVCENCGATQSGWMGHCPECGEWNTMVESVVDSPSRSVSGGTTAPATTLSAKAYSLDAIPPYAQSRMPVPMEELSRVLGGGIVPGSVVLVSGDPGIGSPHYSCNLPPCWARGQSACFMPRVKSRCNRSRCAPTG